MVVVLRVGVGRQYLILASKGVFSFVSSLGGMVRMLMICFWSSSIVMSVLCESWCIRVFERLSRAMRLKSMGQLRSVIMSLLIVFGQKLLRFPPVNWENGAVVGKRLVAMRSPSSRRSWILFALSSICVFV